MGSGVLGIWGSGQKVVNLDRCPNWNFPGFGQQVLLSVHVSIQNDQNWTRAQTGISKDLAKKCSKRSFVWISAYTKGHLCGFQPIQKVILKRSPKRNSPGFVTKLTNLVHNVVQNLTKSSKFRFFVGRISGVLHLACCRAPTIQRKLLLATAGAAGRLSDFGRLSDLGCWQTLHCG